jgi:hypothetical protein
MTHHSLTTPEQPINELTIADLEVIIAEVVRRVLREEMRRQTMKQSLGESWLEAFQATFGAWEDSRSAEAIVSEIYDSRTISTNETSL